jgi:hypothetical protein
MRKIAAKSVLFACFTRERSRNKEEIDDLRSLHPAFLFRIASEEKRHNGCDLGSM